MGPSSPPPSPNWLRFTSVLLLVGVLLPVSISQREAIWPWQLSFDPGFVVATVLIGVAAVTVWIMASRPGGLTEHAPLPLGLVLGATTTSLFGQTDLASSMGGDRILNWIPLAIAVGSVAGADLGANNPRSRRRAQLAAGLGCLALVVFLVSPTPYGTVLAQMSNQLRFALEPGQTLMARITATLAEVMVVGLVAATVFVATGVMQGRPRGPERVYILAAAFGLVVLADTARGALDAGLSGFLVTARTVILWHAVLALFVALVSALPNWHGSRHSIRPRRWLAIAGALLLSSAAAHGLSQSDSTQPWPLHNKPPRWAAALYEDAVPTLARSASASAQREAAGRIVLALAEPVPELRDALARLLPLLDDPGYHRKAISSQIRKVNRAARAAEIPFYLDADISLTGSGTRAAWTMHMQAYRIQASRSALNAAQSLPMLWVESTQPNVGDAQGFAESHTNYGLVILDLVRRNWDRQLAPSLVGLSPGAPFYSAYGQYAVVLRDALEHAVMSRAPSRWGDDATVAFDRYLVCLAGQLRGTSTRLAQRYCPELVAEVEPLIIEALALNVERHELQHMIDDQNGGVAVPDEVRSTLRGFTTQSLRRTSAELSAYLAEIADGPMPHLSLAHLVAVATSRPGSPEAAAGEVARWFLSSSGSWDESFAIDADELRDRARRSYFDLFDRTIPRVVPTTLVTH
ncbi:MAG: hypothetical protein AAFZ38_02130 [Myxococcota bacterium]